MALDALDPRARRLLDLVDEAYQEADADRLLVERSLDITSQELLSRNRRLQQELVVRQGTETALKASEERYRVLFDASPVSVLVFEPGTYRIVESNRAAAALYGYSREELAGMTMLALTVDPDDPESQVAGPMPPRGFSGTKAHRRRDGTAFDVEITSHLVLLGDRRVVLAMGTDVTQTRRLEAELRQAQKMEAIGRLAGGVAHDFNNMLAVILTGADLALCALEEDHPARVEIADVEAAARRAAALTRQLLTFSRKQPCQPRVMALNSVVVDLQKMLTRLIGADVEMCADLAPRLGSVEVDPGQIEQVLLNLVVNARDAMPEGGRLTIETGNVVLDSRQASEIGTPPGSYVRLAVTDTGCGMDPVTRSRIFEPFFTTKEVGQGTGLGLSTVFGIVKQAGGGVRVESEVGHGTTFNLFFPCVVPPAGSAGSLRPVATAPGARRGSETILLVEDDDQVRAVVRRLIAARGYTVLAVSGPEMALEVLREQSETVDLVVSDLVMPVMDGRSMVERMRSFRPGLRVLFMSGYSEHRAIPEGAGGAGEHFIQKPFAAQEMAAALRRALGDRSSRPP